MKFSCKWMSEALGSLPLPAVILGGAMLRWRSWGHKVEDVKKSGSPSIVGICSATGSVTRGKLMPLGWGTAHDTSLTTALATRPSVWAIPAQVIFLERDSLI